MEFFQARLKEVLPGDHPAHVVSAVHHHQVTHPHGAKQVIPRP